MTLLKSYEEFLRKESAFKIKVTRDLAVTPKKFSGHKYLSFFVRICLDIDNAKVGESIYTFNDVSLVKYELHPSYRDRNRVSDNVKNNFEIGVWTYGFYPITATIYFKLGGSVTVSGNVEFPVSEEERKINRGEVG